MKKQRTNEFVLSILCVFVLIAFSLNSSFAYESTDKGKIVEVLNVKELSMRQFARLLSQGSEWKIITSSGASDIIIRTYLEDVHVEDALKAICQAYNLWYKKDPSSGVISIITLEEYQKGMRIHDTEAVEVITLRYPDARAVGDALQRLFSDRVVWHKPDDEEEGEKSIEELEYVLERMDALADRAQFSIDTNSSGGNSSSSRSSRNSYNRNSRYSNNGRYSRNTGNYRNSRYSGSSLSGSSLQENKVVEDIERETDPEALLEMLSNSPDRPVFGRIDQPGIVYISVFKGSNDLLLRSSDQESLKDVIDVVKKLDKPKPQVLLEVKVLDIFLDDGESRGVDWLFETGDFIADQPLNQTNPRATVLQLVTDNVLARIELLEESNRIRRLATPTLCVADNEASRVFVGTETTILKSVRIDKDTTSGDNPVVTVTTEAETERRNIGTTLLITPRIHADRTATIRIVQEESSLGVTQTINYGDDSFQSQDIESSSVVTTIVAADGKISAIGGLIRDVSSDGESGTPVLKDLPVVGSLFKSETKATKHHELLVLIRPFILLAPGEAEPVSKEILERISRYPSALYDIPASRIDMGDLPTKNENPYDIPSDAFEGIKRKASIWTTE